MVDRRTSPGAILVVGGRQGCNWVMATSFACARGSLLDVILHSQGCQGLKPRVLAPEDLACLVTLIAAVSDQANGKLFELD
jgi:hypothetical protein